MKAFALWCAAGVFAFHVLLASRTTLWDRDEPRFARAAVQMVESGQYLYPMFGGDVRAQKPVLIYWLMALSIHVLGVSEVAVRFWSPVGLAVTAFATYAIAERLFSPRAGLVAMAVVALNPMAVVEGTLATTDAVLMAAITTATAAFVARTRAAGFGALIVYTIALAAALLAKGPVGLLPVVVIAAALSVERDRRVRFARLRECGIATLAAAALFLAWWIPANHATGGRFFSQGVRHDIVERVLGAQEGHGGNPLIWLPFYPLVIAIAFAPWSAHLPAALRQLRSRTSAARDARWLIASWIACPLVVFSAAATHLPHYMLPAWPALALAIAMTIDAEPSLRPRLSLRRVRTLAAAVVAIEAAIGLVAMPMVDRQKPVPRLAETIRRTAPHANLATFGFDEPSLEFYLNATPLRLASSADVVSWAQVPEPGVLVTTRRAIGETRVAALREIASASGINVANGQRLELVALARGNP